MHLYLPQTKISVMATKTRCDRNDKERLNEIKQKRLSLIFWFFTRINWKNKKGQD